MNDETLEARNQVKQICEEVDAAIRYSDLYEPEWGKIAKSLETARQLAKQEQSRLIREGEA